MLKKNYLDILYLSNFHLFQSKKKDKREGKKGRQRREETLSGKAVLSLKLSGPEGAGERERERAALAKR